MKISDRIMNLRKKHNYTQTELGERLNMSHSVYNRIERGTRPVREEELNKLAEIFNVSTDYLLGRENVQAPLSREQKTLLRDFESLTSSGRQMILGMLDSLKVTHAAAR